MTTGSMNCLRFELPWGMFRENFTTTGLFETELNFGDKFRVGLAAVMVTEPWMPCYKIEIKFGRSDMIKKFLASERTGFYFAVLQESEVGAGDPIELIERSKDSLSMSDITRLYTREKHNIGLLRRALEAWRSLYRDEAHNPSSTVKKKWASLVPGKVDISTRADKSSRNRRRNPSEAKLQHLRLSSFSHF